MRLHNEGRDARKCTWRYVLEYGRDSNGARLQTSKSGFATKAAAQDALQQMVRTLMTDVNLTSLTTQSSGTTCATSTRVSPYPPALT